MKTRRPPGPLSLAAPLAAGLLAACATIAEPEIPKEHPASPEAVEAPLPPRSRTLDLAASDPFPTAPARESKLPYAGHAPHGAPDPHAGHERPAPGPPPAPEKPPAPAPGPGETAPAPRKKVTYTCPMHPEVVSDEPARCPKCGMKLEPPEAGTKP